MGKCQAASGCVRPKHRRMSRRRGRRVARARDRRASEAARRRVKCSSQGPTATLKGKLTEKVRYRPTTAIEPLLPVGSESLETLPVVRPGACCRTIWCDRSRPRKRWPSILRRDPAHGRRVLEEPREEAHARGARHVHGLGGHVHAAVRLWHVRHRGRRRTTCVTLFTLQLTCNTTYPTCLTPNSAPIST